MPSLSDVGLTYPFRHTQIKNVNGSASSFSHSGIDIGALAVYL